MRLKANKLSPLDVECTLGLCAKETKDPIELCGDWLCDVRRPFPTFLARQNGAGANASEMEHRVEMEFDYSHFEGNFENYFIIVQNV